MDRRRVFRWMGVVLAALLTGGAAGPLGQTNSANASAVRTWTLDLQRSDFGTEPKPQSLTLTNLSDTPTRLLWWRVDVVDDKQNPFSYSWSGPKDGSMHPMKAANGQELWQQRALLRHGELSGGRSFDSRATMAIPSGTSSARRRRTARR